MRSFNFKSAANTKEATKLASGRATFLAGGMTTFASNKTWTGCIFRSYKHQKRLKVYQVLKCLVNLYGLELQLHMLEVAASKEVGKSIASLAILADGIGDPQVRNRGTIGGSIANNDPAADYPSACLALNATIHTSKRKIPADKFFKGIFETDLKKGELIEAIEFEVPEKSSICKISKSCLKICHRGCLCCKIKKRDQSCSDRSRKLRI